MDRKKKALTNYKRRLKYGSGEITYKRALDFVKYRTSVWIFESDEVWAQGCYRWVVSTGDGFWLDAFQKGEKGKEKAIQFCKDLGLPYEVLKEKNCGAIGGVSGTQA